jgi:hypothetical protein
MALRDSMVTAIIMAGIIVIGAGGKIRINEKPASSGLFYCSMISL